MSEERTQLVEAADVPICRTTSKVIGLKERAMELGEGQYGARSSVPGRGVSTYAGILVQELTELAGFRPCIPKHRLHVSCRRIDVFRGFFIISSC